MCNLSGSTRRADWYNERLACPAHWAGLISTSMILVFFCAVGCDGPLNNPYPQSETDAEIYYTSFFDAPKHLDPAKSYSSDEYEFLAQIYEPPFDYHYLKRPYELVPLSAQAIPDPIYYDNDGNRLSSDPPKEKVHRVTYVIRIKPGILYQNHPCFAKAPDGSPYYKNLEAKDLAGVNELSDLPKVGTRQLLAKDFVTQICRLADPRLSCPIYSNMTKYILGLEGYHKAVSEYLDKQRGQRRKKVGVTYDPVRDERANPIPLDYGSIPLEGAKIVDDHTYIITLKTKYPQMRYWLAMPFFVPMPQEALDFYAQPALVDKDIMLNRYPVGTGPYRFETYDRNRHLVLVRNENFREDHYPSEGNPRDKELGLLHDAGKKIPFVERIVYKREKESLPTWNKFLQGYYDLSGIAEESYDRVIQVDQTGPSLTEEMKDKGIKLSSSVSSTIYYLGFNMLDPIVGGYTPQKQKLRQAISIAIDNEEWIDIFSNGRGTAPHGPIPPGVFGGIDGHNGYNPTVYDWDKEANRPVRKTLVDAKSLLVEAGYAGGLDQDGQPIEIGFDSAWASSALQTRLRWIKKKVEALGIRMKIRSTDYSTFRDKVMKSNYQMLFWGWHADYPDPENFLFLLYGPNGKKASQGENAANYDNPQVNRLFEEMEIMSDGPERKQIIDDMVSLIQRDAPWVFMSHPVSYGLTHQWVYNRKPNDMSYNTKKYMRIDPQLRREKRRQWNAPVYWPIILAVLIVVLIALPAVHATCKDR